MNNFGKFLIPALILVFIATIYLFYFSPARGLGSFDEVDPEAHVQKELLVRFSSQDGLNYNSNRTQVIFYAIDRIGTKVKVVSSTEELPEGLANAELITILGHFHGDQFDAVSVEITE